MAPVVVLKLGGALLTDKAQPDCLRPPQLVAAAAEIRECLDAGLIGRLILLHGVGSFGHPPVLAHRLHLGLQSADQLLPLGRTQHNVLRLRMALVAALHDAGVPACLLLPSSCLTARGGALDRAFWDAVDGFGRIGMVPLLGGDVLADAATGFAVYSADKLAVDLALHAAADWLIFATQVDGVYERDPVLDPTARRLPRLSLGEQTAAALDDRPQLDASGAMAGKLRAVQRAHSAVAAGLRTWLISMAAPGNLRALLEGRPSGGTQFVA